MNPFDYQVGGRHYKQWAIDPYRVIATWPKWAGDVFQYLVRGKGEDDFAKAMHCLQMFSEMDDHPGPMRGARDQVCRFVEVMEHRQDELRPVLEAVADYLEHPGNAALVALYSELEKLVGSDVDAMRGTLARMMHGTD